MTEAAEWLGQSVEASVGGPRRFIVGRHDRGDGLGEKRHAGVIASWDRAERKEDFILWVVVW
jgi:hypothetical protein